MDSQSTNDVYPTALKIADIRMVTNLVEVTLFVEGWRVRRLEGWRAGGLEG